MQMFILNEIDFPRGFEDDSNSEIMFWGRCEAFIYFLGKNPKTIQLLFKVAPGKPPFIHLCLSRVPSATVSHQNGRWAAAYLLIWLTRASRGCSFRALLCTTVPSKQKTISFHSPFTLPMWDENMRIKNRKQLFSNSSSESKSLLFIDSQVSWNHQHKLTLDTKFEQKLPIMLAIWPFWHKIKKKSSEWKVMIYCKNTKKAPTLTQS